MLNWKKLVESKIAPSTQWIWLCVAIMLQSNHAYAIDLQPNDARPPPPGISSFQITYQHSERGDFYKNGDKVATDRQISSDLYLWRVGRSFEIANHPAYLYLQVPTGAVHPQKALAPLGGDSGVGDATLLLAFWPYVNRETKTYFGLGAYLSLPTGSYDKNRYFNMGENVYRTALQAAYQQPLADKLSVMAAFDIVWTGNNSEYRLPFSQAIGKLEQSAQYNTQVVLSYAVTPSYDLAAGYYYTLGAEGTINGIDQDNAKDLHRYQIFANAKYPIGRFTLQYGSDIKTENGYFEDHRLMLRYMKAF
jgi:hypothetical protein